MSKGLPLPLWAKVVLAGGILAACCASGLTDHDKIALRALSPDGKLQAAYLTREAASKPLSHLVVLVPAPGRLLYRDDQVVFSAEAVRTLDLRWEGPGILHIECHGHATILRQEESSQGIRIVVDDIPTPSS